jgi:two-component system, NtrC family, sensor kinase
MSWYSKLSLRTKFVLVTSLLVIAICAGLYFFQDRVIRGYLRSEMQRQAGEIALNLETQLANFADSNQIQESAQRLLNERREISRITVYRRIGNYMEPFTEVKASDLPINTNLYRTAVASRTPFRFEFTQHDKEYWEFAYPILSDSQVIGLIVATMNFSQYKILLSAIRSGTLAILIAGLILLTVFMIIYVGVEIQRPLAEIVSAMNEVKASNFDVRLPPRDPDEIGTLVDGFNSMALTLKEARNAILEQNQMLENRVQEATSEVRARNLELFEAQDELRRASRLAMAGQIAAMLAHDLGSPLSSISGHLQLMMEDPSCTPEEKERLNLLLSQVERLSDTIRNFLTNVSDLRAHFEEISINNVVQHMIRLTGPVLTQRKIEAILDLDPAVVPVLADANQLQQLFLNIFTNAIDAMKEGGRLMVKTRSVGQAEVSADSAVQSNTHGWIEVEVADTGAGMNPEQLKNLFRPFFSTKEFGTGTGLGLAICKEIVKAHGGQIQVESQPNQGTKFTILLPIRRSGHNGKPDEA